MNARWEKENRQSERDFRVPRSLDEARNVLLGLSGIEHYVKDKNASNSEIDRGLDEMIDEVTREVQAEYEIIYATNALGWSQKTAQDFFQDPDHFPFKSKIRFFQSNIDKQVQFMMIGTYLRFRYEKAKKENPQGARQEGQRLISFYEQTAGALFAKDYFDWVDGHNGINPEDRRNGTIYPTAEILGIIQEESIRVAQELGLPPEKLTEEVRSATLGGNFILAPTFLRYNKGDLGLRRVLQKVVEKRTKDLNLTREILELLWTIEGYRLSLGIDLEEYYAIKGYPSFEKGREKILKFLRDPEEVAKIWKYLEEGAQEPVSYWDILLKRAERLNFPDDQSTTQELEEKKRRVLNSIKEISPLAASESPRTFFEAPTNIGANQRPFNFSYFNQEERIVIIDVLNPRFNEDLMEAVTGHEVLGHKLHAYLLGKGEEVGYVEKGAFEKIPSVRKERFAQIVENQIRVIQKMRHQGDNLSDDSLYGLLIMRRLGPYALVQQAVRFEMERMLRKGKRFLTTKEKDKLIDTFQPLLDEWSKEGINITSNPSNTLSQSLNPLMPDDGLCYLGGVLKDIVPQKGVLEKDPIDTVLEEVFQREDWIREKNARATFFALLVESGKDYTNTTDASYIRQLAEGMALPKLKLLGISEEEI